MNKERIEPHGLGYILLSFSMNKKIRAVNTIGANDGRSGTRGDPSPSWDKSAQDNGHDPAHEREKADAVINTFQSTEPLLVAICLVRLALLYHSSSTVWVNAYANADCRPILKFVCYQLQGVSTSYKFQFG